MFENLNSKKFKTAAIVTVGTAAGVLLAGHSLQSKNTPEAAKETKELIVKKQEKFNDNVYVITKHVFDSAFNELKSKHLGDKPVLDTNAFRLHGYEDPYWLDSHLSSVRIKNGFYGTDHSLGRDTTFIRIEPGAYWNDSVLPKYRWRVRTVTPGDLEYRDVYGDDRGVDSAMAQYQGWHYCWDFGYVVDTMEDITSKVKDAVFVRDSLLSVLKKYEKDLKTYETKEDSLRDIALHQYAYPVRDSLKNKYEKAFGDYRQQVVNRTQYRADIIRSRNRH